MFFKVESGMIDQKSPDIIFTMAIINLNCLIKEFNGKHQLEGNLSKQSSYSDHTVTSMLNVSCSMHSEI